MRGHLILLEKYRRMKHTIAPLSIRAVVLVIFPVSDLYNEMGIVIAWADVATSMDQMSVGSNDTVASFLTEILSGGDLGHKFFTSQPLQSSSLVIVVS